MVYCHRYEVNGKRRWETIGPDLQAAATARVEKESALILDARSAAQPKPSPKAPESLEALRAYETLTREFVDFAKVRIPAEITKQVLKAWITALYERKRQGSEECVSHRTVVNFYILTVCFLHYIGIDHKRLVPEAERPAAVEEEPEAYTENEMVRFFAIVTNERDRLAFTFLRRTGAREREMSHLEWTNLNLGEKPTVTFRNQGGFKTKTRKFRTIPLDPDFATELRFWKTKQAGTKYVFGTKGDKVEGHFLRLCKAYAKASGQDVENFWLHKFRDSAATVWLLRGVPLRTVQKWMGHSSITMTERYLAPEQNEIQQTLMANVWRTAPLADSATA